MGSVETLTDEQGKVRGYLARWRERSGRGQKKTFLKKDGHRKKDAENHVIKMERAKTERSNTKIDEKVTVAELVSEYIALCEERGKADRYLASMRSTYKTQIKSTDLGRTAAADLDFTDVQKWASRMRRTKSAGYTRTALTYVRAALAVAVRDKRLHSNVASHPIDIKPDEHAEEFIPLEVSDVERILEHLDPLRAVVVRVQAQAGPRVGEALGLLRREIDLERQVIHFRMQLDPVMPVRVRMKTTSSPRDVPIGDRLTAELREYFDLHPRMPDDFAFLSDKGQPWQYTPYNDGLTAAGEAAGLPGVTSHDLRHHYASVLISRGVHLLVIARNLGHKKIRQVEITYGHLLKGTDTTMRDALNQTWGEAQG